MSIRNATRRLTATATAGIALFAAVGPAAAADLDPRLQARLSSLAGKATPAKAAAAPAAQPAKYYGPSFPTLSEDVPPDGRMSDATKQSIGCVLTGSGGTALAVWAGGENLVNVIAGGMVVPANAVVLYTGLVGVVFASFCAIGQALTPLYMHLVETPEPPPRDAGRQVRRTDNLRPRLWADSSYVPEPR